MGGQLYADAAMAVIALCEIESRVERLVAYPVLVLPPAGRHCAEIDIVDASARPDTQADLGHRGSNDVGVHEGVVDQRGAEQQGLQRAEARDRIGLVRSYHVTLRNAWRVGGSGSQGFGPSAPPAETGA